MSPNVNSAGGLNQLHLERSDWPILDVKDITLVQASILKETRLFEGFLLALSQMSQFFSRVTKVSAFLTEFWIIYVFDWLFASFLSSTGFLCKHLFTQECEEKGENMKCKCASQKWTNSRLKAQFGWKPLIIESILSCPMMWKEPNKWLQGAGGAVFDHNKKAAYSWT